MIKLSLLSITFFTLISLICIPAHAGRADCELDIKKRTFSGLAVGMPSQDVRALFEGRISETTWPDEAQGPSLAIDFICGAKVVAEIQQEKVVRILVAGAASARLGSKAVLIGSTFGDALLIVPEAKLHYGLAEGPYATLTTGNAKSGRVALVFDVESSSVESAKRSPVTAKKIFSQSLLRELLISP